MEESQKKTDEKEAVGKLVLILINTSVAPTFFAIILTTSELDNRTLVYFYVKLIITPRIVI